MITTLLNSKPILLYGLTVWTHQAYQLIAQNRMVEISEKSQRKQLQTQKAAITNLAAKTSIESH